MGSAANEAYYGDGDIAWPKFMTRDDDDQANRAQPPPLPHGPAIARVRRLWIESPRRHTLGALFLICSCGVAAALAAAGARQSKPEAASVAPVVQSVEVAAVPEKFQTRLSASEAQGETSVAIAPAGEWQAETTVEEIAVATNDADALSVIILRNLPEGVTFPEGAPAGKGEWVMAAGDGDIDQLAASLGSGLDQPVTADVEMISRSGTSMGALRLELRKSIEEIPEQAVAAGNIAEAVPAPQQAAVRPAVAKKKNAQVRKPKKVARADAATARRVERTEKWKTVTAQDDAKQSEAQEAALAKSIQEQESPGLMAKFFSMFSNGNQQKSGPDHEDNPMYGIAPRD